MAEEKNICASCGSANAHDALICDICGHDLTVKMEVVESTAEAAPAAAPSAPAKTAPKAPLAKPKKKSSGKAGAKSPASDPVFSTMQWVAITIAAFILGGVITASLLPSTESGQGSVQDEGTMTQGAQPDLQRLNATKAALDANPNDPAAILAYANALHDASMTDQAIVQYKSYLSKNADDPDARVDLGICYFEKQEFALAIEEMERAVTDHPDHQLGTYNLGIVNLNAGNKEKAREWFTKARDMDPNSPHGKNAAQLLSEHF
ncbi:MAG: tetratricopeptide repeat protein [Bacteroidetes bacterium]|nr:tetratricopeptide repeat protein [Bacteroidota bacterium]